MEKSYKDLDKKLFYEYCKNEKYFPLIFDKKRRIIAIGDLHGDFELTIQALKLSNVINNELKWIGDDTYVIQVGDQLDNCRPNKHKCNEKVNINKNLEAEDIKVFNYMTELNNQAIKDNGAVISLLGNHELLNVMGQFNYVSYNDLHNFKNTEGNKSGANGRKESFKPGNEYSKILACTRLPAVIVGSFIFVHAGFVNGLMEKLKIKKRDDLYKLSYSLKKWLLGLINKDYVVNIINNSSDSPFWDRIVGSIPPNVSNNDPRCVQHINKVLDIFKVKGMVVGHTPQYFAHHEGINSTCGNSLFRIDFGGSFGFNNFDQQFNSNNQKSEKRQAQVLEILNDNQIKILM